MYVGFGAENPVRCALMYRREGGRRSRAAQAAEAELRRGLEQLASAGLHRTGLDEAVAVTTAMAVGCVTQLTDGGGAATGPVARSMRAALMSELTGHSPGSHAPARRPGCCSPGARPPDGRSRRPGPAARGCHMPAAPLVVSSPLRPFG
jgi:hypothetical protein